MKTKTEIEKIITSEKTTKEILDELHTYNILKQLQKIRHATDMIELYEEDDNEFEY